MVDTSQSLPVKPIPSPSAPKFAEWNWILTLFGTAVGAGILYLPLQVGAAGGFSLLFLSALVFPLIYYSHKAIVSLLLSQREELDYTGVVTRHFGSLFGQGVVIVFLITFYAVLFSYSVGLNANLGGFLHEMEITSTNWANGPYLSLFLLASFAALHAIGDKTVLRLMSVLSSVLLVVLLGISLYLIPLWNFSSLRHIPSGKEFIENALLILPILTFSFVFFPAMSSMVTAYRNSRDSNEAQAHRRLHLATLKTSLLLLVFVLFFVFSSILSLDPQEFERAAKENLNCLTILSYKEAIPDSMSDVSALVGLCALITSFSGVFFAVRDASHRLANQALTHLAKRHALAAHLLAHSRPVHVGIWLFLFSSLWILTLINPSVMNLFGMLISLLVAFFLFILPVALLVKTSGFRILKHPSLPFVFLTGILTLFSFELGTWLKAHLGP